MRTHILHHWKCIIYAFFFFLQSSTFAQTEDLKDWNFGIQEVELNYAGFPDLNAEEKAEYATLKHRLQAEVIAQHKKGYEALGELLGWFNDFHLRCGMYTELYMKRKQPNYGEIEYNPCPFWRKIDELTFLIRFPSCEMDDSTATWVEKSITAFLASRCEYLILDIRGNGGGRDNTYYPYLSLVYNKKGKREGIEIRNSPDNRAYVRECVMENKELEGLLNQMNVSKKEFVSIGPRMSSISQDTVYVLPRKIALIIDRCVASSGEQMVIDMRACSTRTVVYGKENTLGCLDYSNVRMVNLPYSRITLYVPMTRSCRLPDGGIDKKGIAPDIRLDLPLPARLTDNVDEWVRWVAEDLKKR